MPQEDSSSVSAGVGENVRVYERPSKITTLAPLIWIVVAAIVLLIVFVLLKRQN